MTDRDHLISAFIDYPGDDVARLALADLLEEEGEEAEGERLRNDGIAVIGGIAVATQDGWLDHGPSLAARCSSVKLSRRKPVEIFDSFRWACDGFGSYCVLPRGIWDAMDLPVIEAEYRWKWAETEAVAMAALSPACLKWALAEAASPTPTRSKK